MAARFSLLARARGLARSFRSEHKGSAAVEFALVAPIFFALIFAIIETALVFFAGQLLETAAQDAARLVMTGQTKNSSQTQDQFKTALCARLSSMFDCMAGAVIDVQSYSSFSSVTMTSQINSNREFVPISRFSIGDGGDIVIVRIFYQWPLFVTGLGYNIANLKDNKRLLVSTSAFKNEPF